jgi:hypothetical protein
LRAIRYLLREAQEGEEKMPALRSLGVAGSWDDEIRMTDDTYFEGLINSAMVL